MNRVLVKMLLLATTVPSLAYSANWTLIRRIGQVASCAASMADARTTLRPGLVETNPLLGAGKPQPARILSLKLGMCAVQFVAERHKSRAKDKLGAVSGFAQAGIYTGLALHNEQLKEWVK